MSLFGRHGGSFDDDDELFDLFVLDQMEKEDIRRRAEKAARKNGTEVDEEELEREYRKRGLFF